MALKLEDKQAIVAEVNEVASSAYSVVIAEYRGMSVGAMTALRAKARNDKVYLKVVRNTLARRAVEGTEFACIQQALVGPYPQTADRQAVWKPVTLNLIPYQVTRHETSQCI